MDDWSNGVTEQIRENMGDVHYDLEDNVDYDSDYEVRSGKIELYVLGMTVRASRIYRCRPVAVS